MTVRQEVVEICRRTRLIFAEIKMICKDQHIEEAITKELYRRIAETKSMLEKFQRYWFHPDKNNTEMFCNSFENTLDYFRDILPANYDLNDRQAFILRSLANIVTYVDAVRIGTQNVGTYLGIGAILTGVAYVNQNNLIGLVMRVISSNWSLSSLVTFIATLPS